jgi:hypothetical protein
MKSCTVIFGDGVLHKQRYDEVISARTVAFSKAGICGCCYFSYGVASRDSVEFCCTGSAAVQLQTRDPNMTNHLLNGCYDEPITRSHANCCWPVTRSTAAPNTTACCSWLWLCLYFQLRR